MSSLYLTLVRRIEEVQSKAHLGTEVMRSARKAKGLSYESAAREIHVSAKTYERWEKAGEVPMRDIANVARVLDLDIEHAERHRITLDPEVAEEATDAALARAIAELRLAQEASQEVAQRIEALLVELLRRDGEAEGPSRAAPGD